VAVGAEAAAGVEVVVDKNMKRKMIRMQTKKCIVGFSSFLIEKLPLTFTASRGLKWMAVLLGSCLLLTATVFYDYKN
jgi:hypothetical protein